MAFILTFEGMVGIIKLAEFCEVLLKKYKKVKKETIKGQERV